MLDRIFTQDPIFSRLQDNVSKALRKVQGNVDSIEGYDPEILTFDFSGGATITVAHSLGRVPTGWYVVDIDANVALARTAWTESDLTLTIGAFVGTPLAQVAVF